jgi:outer membrane protein assembly factor BamB
MFSNFLIPSVLWLAAPGGIQLAWAQDAVDCSQDDPDGVILLQTTSSLRDTETKLEREIHEASTASSTSAYPWSQRGRDYTTSGASPYNAPVDFSGGAKWTWPNADDEQVRHSPLIDNDNNIYVTTGWKLRKFNSEGKELWALDTEKQVSAPALYKDHIFGVGHTESGLKFFSVDIADGKVVLEKSIHRNQDGDASSVFVYNDTAIFAVNPPASKDQTHNVYAVNASDGSFLWEYAPDDVLWNFAPSTPGDGTLLFAGSCGRAFKITFEGKLMWKAGPLPMNSGRMCGTGGGALGPNGTFYNEYNQHHPSGKVTSHLSARQVSDGHQLWVKEMKFSDSPDKTSGNQYPAIGDIQIGDSKILAVVAAIGHHLGLVDKSPLPEDQWLPNAIVAMDAKTGDVLWRYDQPKWNHLVAEGDNKAVARELQMAAQPKTDVWCLPDPQGIPTISGDGTVYMSSSTSGYLRSLKDKNGNGVIEPSEVSSFETHNCFLNSPSIGKDMLVAAPCWGPMYVFKSDTQ